VFAAGLSYGQMNLRTKFRWWRSVSSEDLMVLWLALQSVNINMVFGSSSQLIPDKVVYHELISKFDVPHAYTK
jgi:hypothetical protein